MSKPATHILIEFESKDMTLLYRASDGMSLGCRTGINVVFGETRDPQKLVSRGFLDTTYARAYLRRCADLDVNHIPPEDERQSFGPGETLGLEYAASFDEREGESRIVQPSNGLRN
jgi:hypothetical protein